MASGRHAPEARQVGQAYRGRGTLKEWRARQWRSAGAGVGTQGAAKRASKQVAAILASAASAPSADNALGLTQVATGPVVPLAGLLSLF
jgi:hypothetical protein